MAEIVNLREFRKKKAQIEKANEAARQRALSGRTRAEKKRDKDSADRAKSDLDRKKLDGAGDKEEPNGPGETA